jgi:hypothetical protein
MHFYTFCWAAYGITQPSLEIIFGDLPVKMTSTNEFVPVMKQNVPVIVPYCKNIGYKICNG